MQQKLGTSALAKIQQNIFWIKNELTNIKSAIIKALGVTLTNNEITDIIKVIKSLPKRGVFF